MVIVGARPLGILHVRLATHRGARPMFLIEVDALRRAPARHLTGSPVYDPAAGDMDERFMAAAAGRGADVLIMASSGRGFDSPLAGLMAPPGRVMLFSGLSGPLAELGTDAKAIHYSEFVVTGSYGCTARANRQAIQLLGDGALAVEDLIARRVGMARTADALCARPDGNHLKIIMEV